MLIHINTGSQTPSRENEETRIYENQNVCVSVHTYKILIIKTTLGSALVYHSTISGLKGVWFDREVSPK